jgi:hypothetical protein
VFDTTSTMTRAEVQADAIAALTQQRAIGYISESGLVLKPEAQVISSITRSDVRAAALVARNDASLSLDA